MAKRKASPSRGRPRKKGDRSFVTLVAVLLVIGAGIIGYVVFKPRGNPIITGENVQLPPAKGWVRGSPDAPVEIVEFGDFECPICGQFSVVTEPDVIERLVNTGAARYRFMDFPLAQHLATMVAHNAAACAGAQGDAKFWEMHDKIFLGQPEWSTFANNRDMNAPKVMRRYAREIGLDEKAFDDCLDSRQYELQIRANAEEGNRLGISSTPTFIVGSQRVIGAQPYDVLKRMVDDATAAAKRDSAAAGKGDTAAAAK